MNFRDQTGSGYTVPGAASADCRVDVILDIKSSTASGIYPRLQLSSITLS
jgi:hypothetical protein